MLSEKFTQDANICLIVDQSCSGYSATIRYLRTFEWIEILPFKRQFDIFKDYNLSVFWNTQYGYNLGDYGLWGCRFSVFFQGFSTQSSIYTMVSLSENVYYFLEKLWNFELKVFMSIETNIRVRVKNWRDDYFKPKHALITIISIMIVFSSANAWVLGILPFDSSRIPNNSCRSSNEYKSWLSVRMKIRGSQSSEILFKPNVEGISHDIRHCALRTVLRVQFISHAFSVWHSPAFRT